VEFVHFPTGRYDADASDNTGMGMWTHEQGRIERSVPAIFTASETFDVGVDLGSPVALDYLDRAPFRFNGKIEKIHIRYIE
jgi:hypothetical protein